MQCTGRAPVLVQRQYGPRTRGASTCAFTRASPACTRPQRKRWKRVCVHSTCSSEPGTGSALVRTCIDCVRNGPSIGSVIELRALDSSDLVLQIYVGEEQARALSACLSNQHKSTVRSCWTVSMGRPTTYDLFSNSFAALGWDVLRVEVKDMRESIYIADMVLVPSQRSGDENATTHEIRVDSRPSDVINVAVRAGAPIYVATDVLQANARPATELHNPKPAYGSASSVSSSFQNSGSSASSSSFQSSPVSAPSHRDSRQFMLPGQASHAATTKSMQQLPSPRQREHQSQRQLLGTSQPQFFRRSSSSRSSSSCGFDSVLWLRARLAVAVADHNYRLADSVKDELAQALGCRTSADLLHDLEFAVYEQRFEDAAVLRDELTKLQQSVEAAGASATQLHPYRNDDV